jgi:protein-disulfide isomerase
MNDNQEQADNAERLTKKQRRELRRQEKQSDSTRQERMKRTRRILLIGGAVGLTAIVSFFLFRSNTPADANLPVDTTDPVRGLDTAPVVIEEYSDFQCPACAAAEEALPQVLAAFPTQVKFVYNDYPLSIHPNARPAAEAAQCALAQGKFWDFHDRLFSEQASWSGKSKADAVETFKQYASDLSIDTSVYASCLDNGERRADVNRDVTEGNARKVNSTPTFFVNGVKSVGAKTLEEWTTLIEDALRTVEATNTNSPSTNSTNS